MRTIRGFLELIGVLVVLVAGYWIWYANWGPNPNDRIGTTVAEVLPPAFKNWGCGKLSARFAAEAPSVCSPAASPTSPPATPNAAPGEPASPGGGRL
ncbi:hypothetical protein [Chenggangzhangella methanolivorans]|uniref:Uncharacterized protein n=1 Tax=Chenggangzhangella methanolivorans TaxID=1437009 RepID=A0A9E6R8A3_9HYPH|nr:hypothetical protein [Chenggangzhangella methanolivorans]QZN99664.1 hypothetical protein K6K41_23725 [Chenggangzhangella methanolivorans]